MTDSSESYWQTLDRLFYGALELPADERRAWLQHQCSEEPDLIRYVMELLTSHEAGHCRLDQAITEAARDMVENARLKAGRRLGAYQVLRPLGQGGMGTVYLAERCDAEYRQQVAIKLIRGFPGDDALERLRQERQILAGLSHPNITHLLDGGSTDDGQPYLVMEYIAGMPILQWCQQQELDQSQRVRLILEICDAVHYAHQHLVIHRDIKPSNVLVTADGRPMLTDFGIAKLISAPGTTATTQTPRFYTPGYTSPEQFHGQPITTASDVYSLGKLMLALLEGGVGHATAEETRKTVFRRPTWQRQLPRDLVAIIDQATRTEPERRYPTASALRTDLVHYLEGRAVSAVPDRFGYRLAKFIRRHRTAVIAATVAVAIGLGLIWRLAMEYDRAQSEALRAETTAQFVINMLGSIEPEYADGADIDLMRRVLEDAAARAPVELVAQPLILSDIEYVIGRAFLAIGMHQQAHEHLTLAADLASDTPADPRYLNPQSHLAHNDTMIGEYEAGLARIESVLEQASGHLIADDPLWLDALHIKANLLVLMNENEAAEPMVREIIELTADTTDPFPVNIRFESLRTLAQIHSNLGRYERSIRRYRQILDEAEQWQDPTAKRHIAGALNDQAVALLRQQQYTQAEPLLRESLTLNEQRYGPNHPRLIQVLNNLASSLRQQDKLDQAQPIFERVLTLSLDAFGPDNPTTLVIQYNFGNLLRVRGEAAKAVELQRTVLASAETVYPSSHPAQGMFRLGLGQSELALGNAEAAIPLLREAIPRLTEHYGADYHRTIEAEQALAAALDILDQAEM